MALTPTHLPDTSVLARLGKPAVAKRLAPMLRADQLATCPIVALEMGYTARSGRDYDRLLGNLRAAYPWVAVTEGAFERALDVQRALAQRGKHRAAKLPDLLIAAAAERAGLTVLHYDRDYEVIAGVTGQPVDWVVPAGEAD